MITDRMIDQIMNADLVVADLNANAFYELGIRHAAEKPVIHFAQSETDLPFDAMPHRAVIEDITIWCGIERARQRIREAVRAIEAPDYRVSNPITQARASFKMRESADPSEQVIAELLVRVGRLEARGRVERYEESGRFERPELSLLLNRMPHGTTDVDRMLLAGYFAQQQGADNGFATGEAHTLLTDQGVKVDNPSQCVKQNLLAKRVFKHQGRYRVSQIGLDHLRQLLGSIVI
jgi:hypothetical protein